MTQSALTRRSIPINALTASYRICGDIEVTNTGILGVLNDHTHSYMGVHNVRLARIHMPDKLVEQVGILRLVKRHIYLIGLERRKDIGPQALARGGYERLQQYEVSITDAIYEYTGTLEWPGRFDFSALLADGSRDFIPLYDVRLRGVLLPNVKIKSAAVLFNKNFISTLSLI